MRRFSPPQYPRHCSCILSPQISLTKYVELVPHFHANDPLLHHIELVLQATSNADSTAERLYTEVLTNALAVHLLRRYAACGHTASEMTGGLSPAKLKRTIVYIQAHLEQELSLTTLAAMVHLSPDHFARLFKQATGQTPHQYVLECRIARAKQLLAETDMPLSAISLQVGCTDQSYFTALFRKHVTMTPKPTATSQPACEDGKASHPTHPVQRSSGHGDCLGTRPAISQRYIPSWWAALSADSMPAPGLPRAVVGHWWRATRL